MAANRADAPVRQQRLAVSKAEAAGMLGVSVATLERHILADLRLVYLGRKVLIPVAEVARWLEESAARVIDP